MYKIQDISSFSFFFFLNFMFIINIRWMPLKKFRFFILNTDTEKNYFRDKENIVLAQKVHKVFLSCTYSFFVFYVWEEEVLDTAEKIVSHLKFGFLLLTFKKICLTTLDWDDQLQSFFFTYILSHLVSVSASYFVIGFHFRYFFSWYCCTEKIYAKKGFQREFCLEEREIWRREKWESLSWSQHQTREKVVLKLWKIYYSLEYAILQSLKIACNK